MATTGTRSAYAAHIKATPQYVSALGKKGRLVLVKDASGRELVDFEASDRLRGGTTDMGRAGNGANRARKPEAGAPPAAGLLADGIGELFRKAQAQERAYNAKIAELEYRKLVGQMLPREPTLRAVQTAFRALRDRIMAMSRRLPPKLVDARDLRELQRLVEAEARAVLHDFERQALAQLVAQLDEPGRPAVSEEALQ